MPPPPEGRRPDPDGRQAVSLRAMTLADVDAGLRLCRQSHWNQLARDWQQFLDLNPRGAAVAVDAAGQVIGTVTTIRYAAAKGQTPDVEPSAESTAPGSGSPFPDSQLPVPDTRDPLPVALAWIAMVLVDTAHRGGGIGTALLHHGLDRVADVTTVGLDATPLGQPLYEKLGFRAATTFTRMLRPGDTTPSGRPGSISIGVETRPPSVGVRPATSGDLEAMARLDAHATGLERRSMLAWLLEGAPEFAWVSDSSGGVEGALLGRHGHAASHLGPVIASSTKVAVDLVRACLSAHAARAFLIDIADDRPGWRSAVEPLGFAEQRPFTRMYRGDWRPAGHTAQLFAIIGAEFG